MSEEKKTEDYRPGFPVELVITTGTTVSLLTGQSSKKGEDEGLGFYPREDYLLCEIFGRISIFRTRKLVEEYIRKYRKPACIRGAGRSVGTAVTMAHLMKEEVGLWRTYFDTFTGVQKDGRKITGIQIVMIPVEVLGPK